MGPLEISKYNDLPRLSEQFAQGYGKFWGSSVSLGNSSQSLITLTEKVRLFSLEKIIFFSSEVQVLSHQISLLTISSVS